MEFEAEVAMCPEIEECLFQHVLRLRRQ